MKKKTNFLVLLLMIIFLVGCTNGEDGSTTNGETDLQEVTVNIDENNKKEEEKEETITTVVEEPVVEEPVAEETVIEETPTQSNDEQFSGYKLIEVDGGNMSGYREPNVVVDIGFGDREYWAFTNEYGQLVRVIAEEIILQDDNTEPVTSSG